MVRIMEAVSAILPLKMRVPRKPHIRFSYRSGISIAADESVPISWFYDAKRYALDMAKKLAYMHRPDGETP